MALSNWLTRGEWSAAFLAYLTGVDFSEDPDPEAFPFPVDLSTHLRVGICLLHQSGYTKWKGITVADPHSPHSVAKSEQGAGVLPYYGVNSHTAEGDNSECLVEILRGTLDYKARAAETLIWLDAHPEVDFPALRELCLHISKKGA